MQDTHVSIDTQNDLAWELQTTDTANARLLAEETLEQSLSLDYQHGIAQALNVLARVRYICSDYEASIDAAKQSLEIFRNLNDKSAQSTAMITLGLNYHLRGELDLPLTYYTEALKLAEESKDRLNQASSLRHLGNYYREHGDSSRASVCFNRSLNIAKELHDNYLIGSVLNSMGMLANAMGEFESSLGYYKQAFESAEKDNNLSMQANCLLSIGVIHVNCGRYPEALECYNHSKEILAQLGNRPAQLARLLHNIGVVYEELGTYDIALDYWLQSAGMLEEIGDTIALSNALQAVGAGYLRMNVSDKALQYFNRSLVICRQSSYRDGEGRALRYIGEVYQQREAFKNAIEYYQQSLNVVREIGNKSLEADSLHQLGEAFMLSNLIQDASNCFFQSLELSEHIGTPYYRTITRIRLAEVLLRQQHRTEAQEYLRTALELAEQNQTKTLLYEAHKALASLYEQEGDYQQAFYHHKIYFDIRQEVFNDESDKRMKNLAVQYEVERKEREAEIHRLKNVELVQLNDDLRQANRLKNEFLRVAAHDLKNPLAGIMIMTELALQELPPDAPVRRTQDMIYDSSSTMLEIVDKLLEIAKLESGALEIVKEQVDVPELVEDVAARNRLAAERKQQTIECMIAEPCVVQGDRSWLLEALDNLVSNAVKYSPLGKPILIEVRRDEGVVSISVSDEGPGLTDDDKQNLFGAFRRLSALPTGGEHSTGLGLSIARQLVELHGGTISADNRPGSGSVFMIQLPGNGV